MAFATSLEGQTTGNLTAYATSSFSAHSLLSTVLVVQSVVNAVIKPPMAKIADVVGRFEAFCISVLLFTLGYIQQAASRNVQTFVAAQIFYTAGSQGVQILQQIFVADTTNLLDRALFSSIPDLPFLVTVWVGPEIAQSILKHSTWRWGYALWAIVLPVVFMPLALSLFLNQRRAAKRGMLPPSAFKEKSAWQAVKTLWLELDGFGLILLSAGISLVLLPLTLAQSARDGWRSGHIIAMIVVGVVCLIAFPFWERNPKLAPFPFFPAYAFRDRTIVAGIFIAFFYFMAFYLSVFPYFFSYLQVVQGKSVAAAGHITQTFSFSSTVSSIVVSLLIKYTGHYKYFVTFGSCLYVLGLGLMVRYRAQGVSTAVLVVCQVVIGIGGGTLNVPVQLAMQACSRHNEVAATTTIFLTFLAIGGAVGAAISGAVWTTMIPRNLEKYLPDEYKGMAKEIYGDFTIATNRFPMGSPERMAINTAYQDTMRTLLIVAVCVSVPLIPLSLMLRNYKLTKEAHNRDQIVDNKAAAPAAVVGGGEGGERGEKSGLFGSLWPSKR